MIKKIIFILKVLLFALLYISALIFFSNIFVKEQANTIILSIIDLTFFALAIMLCYTVIKVFPLFIKNYIYFLFAYIFWFIGDLMWLLFELKGQEPPSLYFYDIFYLLFYVFLFIALYTNLKPYFSIVKDKKIFKFLFMIYIILVSVIFLGFVSIEENVNLSLIVNSIYPVLDILMLTSFIPFLINIYTIDSSIGKSMLLIGISLIFLILGDIFYYSSIISDISLFEYDILYILAGFGFAYSNIFLLEF